MTHPLLTAPTLPQAIGNGINALAATHLQVDIAPYPGMDEGDLVELFWNNCFAASRRVTACKIGTVTRLRIPESFVLEARPGCTTGSCKSGVRLHARPWRTCA